MSAIKPHRCVLSCLRTFSTHRSMPTILLSRLLIRLPMTSLDYSQVTPLQFTTDNLLLLSFNASQPALAPPDGLILRRSSIPHPSPRLDHTRRSSSFILSDRTLCSLLQALRGPFFVTSDTLLVSERRLYHAFLLILSIDTTRLRG